MLNGEGGWGHSSVRGEVDGAHSARGAPQWHRQKS